MSKTMATLDLSMRRGVHELLLKFQESIHVKIGVELTYSLGFKIVREVKAVGHQIFLDLKLHDIPDMVKQAMENLAKLDVDIVNLYTAGGGAIMEAVVEGLEEGAVNDKRPPYIAVTRLTSTPNEAINEELLTPGDIRDVVISYVKLVKESGLDGVVCSVHEAKAVREVYESDLPVVIPGIRLADDSKDDQKQVVTPTFAEEQGYDHIIAGRSITESADPVATYHEIEKTMEGK